MWDVVHMDEKWFNADQDRRKVYLTPDETVEHRTTKSKRFISKVMFLAALGILINVTAKCYRDFVLSKVIPAIKEKLPSANKRVVLQHDNGTPHASLKDCVLQTPPNSPDLNVFDLGFFASIQALQRKVLSRSVDDVIHATLLAFEMLSMEKLADVFLTLQAVMRLVLEHHGDNHFKLPHLKKEAMRRAGTLMANVTCPVSLIDQADLELQQHGIQLPASQ
ncbi:hypothetical protein Ae201684P_005452 [Aphanomyces euteiches]|nr:hypothetical protein Ae201684P_005356 [Aphanomyces euteiches]KAH9085749.1 hypothetical protein Ae201684P_005452 [Aphanomyces euteiches]